MSLVKSENKRVAPKRIRAKFYHVDTSVNLADMIAVVSFHGKMPDGSMGKQHGKYIAAQTSFWMTYIGAISVVMDFRDLDYKWGDSLLGAFQTLERFYRDSWEDIDRSLPIKLIASEKSSGLYSLISNSSVFFSNVDEAVLSCSEDLEYWLAN